MSRVYIVRGRLAQFDAKAGDKVELDLAADDEDTFLAAGDLELVPLTYKVVGDAEVYDTAKGGTFEAALPVSQEAALLGGHIQLVPPEVKATKKKGGKTDGEASST